MFYSQFILAKKGPLGTIWIAAHLERKLRKNQVADTDIGVSVDSILFPEVPIALRLSSHLLLGVVRIYSRKVNYLFDDCSEALLKIKQAFRSTAVDLPPEESTAPYHSITLPETFDLDDFELPDNDIFQGNYVDHHVSTREQITLQDTMDGVNYSTSQFGLDERFGDGDTSQIGLDLDEELLLDKDAAGVPDGVSDANPQGSGKPLTPLGQTDGVEQINETSEATTVNGNAIQCEGIDMDAEIIDYAEAPCTPGLVEEPNLSSVQEVLACDDRMEVDHHDSDRLLVAERVGNDASKSDFLNGNQNAMNTVPHLHSGDNGYDSKNMEVGQAKPLSDSVEPTPLVSVCSEGKTVPADVSDDKNAGQSAVDHNDIPAMPSVESAGIRLEETVTSPTLINPDMEDPGKGSLRSTDVLISEGQLVDDQTSTKINILEDEAADVVAVAGSPGVVDAVDGQTCLGSKDSETLGRAVVHKEMSSDCTNMLKPCKSSLSRPEMSSPAHDNAVALNLEREEGDPCMLEMSERDRASAEMQGDQCHVTNVAQSEGNQASQASLSGATDVNNRTLDEQMDNALSSENQLQNKSNSMSAELPAPEKLLSVQEGLLYKTNDLLVETTPDREVLVGSGDAGAANQLISGRKRSYTESTLTMESLNSSESFGVTKSKRTAESVPDDDDLLSSILVGRRTSVLKMKPTPPAQQVASRKRARSAPQTSALKRKVLLDDTMVLHGDIIRQQLTNTEDIRRVRKKAPCTCAEILMIQMQFLEDEIFSEPMFTGMSKKLLSLLQGTHDLSKIRISETDENHDSSEVANNAETSVRPNETETRRIEGCTDSEVVQNDEEAQAAETPKQNVNWEGGDNLSGSIDIDTQNNTNARVEEVELKTKQQEESTMINEMDVDRCLEVTDVANCSVATGAEKCSTEVASMDVCDVPGGEASVHMDASCMSPGQKADTELVKENGALVEISHGEGVDVAGIEDSIVGVENGSKTKDEVLLEGKVDVQTDVLPPTENVNAFEAASLETGGCSDLPSANGEHFNTGIENGAVAADTSNGREDRTSEYTCAEEQIRDPACTAENHADLEGVPLKVENPNTDEADLHSRIDADVTAFDHPTAEDRGELEDITYGNDTEFLNVDDDEVAEDYDDDMGSAGETHLLENSGWSSRTRAVAKYLQNLFDKETVHGRKVLELDHLLAGKTRKEASRMFFETLVLKTKDFIQVEQPKPLGNVGLKPRPKLMKSNF